MVTRLLPTYNVGDYGHDLKIFIADQLTAQIIIPSTATFERTTDDGNFPIEDYYPDYNDIDSVALLHEGNNTAFNRIYRWAPDMTAVVYKAILNIGFGLNVSAYTSGNFKIDSVRVRMNQASPVEKPFFDQTIATAFSNMVAVGSQIFIVSADTTSFVEVHQGRPIDIQIEVNETTGTGTRQVGILPKFPMSAAVVLKPFYDSYIGFHVHASLSHADIVFSTYNMDQRVYDLSGLLGARIL